MREGMRIFTNFTNRWKTREDEARVYIKKAVPLSFEDIKVQAQQLHFNPATKSYPLGDIYRPQLPLPLKLEPTMRRISFVKEKAKIEMVAQYFGDTDLKPSDVGERSFDTIYEEARK
jgi:hypothetical protein